MEQPQLDKIKQSLQRYNRPIYETIIDTLQKMIMAGELAPGTKFPPDKKLAIELGISHITLAKALNEMRKRNLLERRRAFGTSVPERKTEDSAIPRRRKIAVVFDSANDETFRGTTFLAIHRELENLNCSMVFFSADGDPAKQQKLLLEIMQDFSISGCLVWSILSQTEAAVVLHERPQNYPLIFMDKYYSDFDHDAVTYRNYDCGAAMGRSIRRHKVSRVYWVCRDSAKEFSSIVNRKKGLCDGLGAHIKVEDVILSHDSGPAVRDWEPDAEVVCGDHLSARYFKTAISGQGGDLPRRCYVFETFAEDHSSISEFIAYRFNDELGTEAVEILASRLNGKEACTVNHSGKWSVLGAKSTFLNKRRIGSNDDKKTNRRDE